MAVTLYFQSTGLVPGNAMPVRMVGKSLTIGRGDENDLVLPDPEKTISKRHCAIEDHDGNVIVVDFSTNGTFLNYGKTALGHVATPLHDGDILSLGAYELLVEITAARAPAGGAQLPPLEEPSASPGRAALAPDPLRLLEDHEPGKADFLDELLGTGAPPAGPSVVQRAEPGDDGLLPPLGIDDLRAPSPAADLGMGASRPAHSSATEDSFRPPRVEVPAAVIPDDWDNLLEPLDDTPDPTDPFAVPAPPADLVPRIPEAVPKDVETESESLPPPAPLAAVDRQPAGQDRAARAFLRSLGAEAVKLDDDDLVPTLSRLGHVLRVMISGLREVLMTRTAIKSEFRIHQTVITAGGNNPLKFSISAEQAVEAMVKPTTRGYLDAVEAAEQALDDIKAHEVAMMTGMEAALKGVLRKLDPAALEARIETSGGIASILKGRKARYWEVYEKMYAEISDQAENDFQELFAREFARAYQAQLEKLKSAARTKERN